MLLLKYNNLKEIICLHGASNMIVQETITNLIREKVTFTDVYVRTGEPLMVRTPGGWISKTEPLTKEEVLQFVTVVGGEHWETKLNASPTKALDIAKTIGGIARLRNNISLVGGNDDDLDSVAVTIRKLDLQPPPYADLGLPEPLLKEILGKKGLWVVSGPTGNGKSTTMASILQHMNLNMSKHIITIEQPIEYVMRPVKGIFSQKEVGQQTPSFNAGLIAALRQRPDVIMIGEVRDSETMETMLQGAESGHQIFASLHTKNVEDTISKMAGFLPRNKISSLASTLCGVISQHLLPTADEKKLVLAYEIMINNTEIQNIIRKEEYQKIGNALANSRKYGCVTLNDRLKELLQRRMVTDKVADESAYDLEAFRREKHI